MGCCTSVATADGAYDPSPFAVSVAVKQKTDYKEESMEIKHTDQAKILVVCTDDGRLKMANGKVFNTGNHPVEMLLPMLHFKKAGFTFEFATVSGGPVVLEMWAFPTKDVEVTAFHKELEPALNAPTKLEDVDASLAGYAGVFIPGGHGAMVNLPQSLALGKLLHSAHGRGMPTITLCHGPATLVAATLVEGGTEFPYKGYKMVTFSDKTDAFTPNIGYIPGVMPWKCQEVLQSHGCETLNTSESGATHVDRELITGDSPQAGNNLGKVATPILVASWAKLSA